MENLNDNRDNTNQVLDTIYRTAQDIKNTAYQRVGDEAFEIHDRIADKAEELQRKYPDYLDYKMYHLLVGSTPDDKTSPVKFDFPGADSVVDFISSI